MGHEEQREDKNQGKNDANFSKGNLRGQFPTKPCINPQNLLHVDRSNCITYNSSAEHSNDQKSDSSYNLSRHGTTINAISALRSWRILSNSEDIKSKETDKIPEIIPEKEELNREGK